MSQALILPDYEHIAESTSPYEPAEIHGILCGMLCLDTTLTHSNWLQRLAHDGATHGMHSAQHLNTLFDATIGQLHDDELAFALLLPDDETNISVRAASLGYWCQGFLTGLGLAGLNDVTQLGDDTREFLNDVSQIAQIGLDGDSGDEEDEAAYIEIIEYLRIGVLLLGQELRPTQSVHTASSQIH